MLFSEDLQALNWQRMEKIFSVTAMEYNIQIMVRVCLRTFMLIVVFGGEAVGLI